MEKNWMEKNWNEPQIELPNATLVLVLGIISIVGCCCTYGTLGIICGIITIVLAKSATDLYTANPGKYTESSYKNVNAGKICAWIGLIPSILYIVFMIFLVVTLGFAVFTDPNVIYEYFGVESPF
ncbi:MAG: hypothetical protein LBS46_07300 [Dysgonamonadaceae bacterium]|jgi:hypothetical protein|nr:hypothetical protein [Dysgonamonadaceae bacterium]